MKRLPLDDDASGVSIKRPAFDDGALEELLLLYVTRRGDLRPLEFLRARELRRRVELRARTMSCYVLKLFFCVASIL